MNRRISILLAGLALFCVSHTNAQNEFKKELMVGPSFGTNFSSVSFMPKIKTKLLMGYHGGVTIRWTTQKNVGLQAEINYSQNGWTEDFEEYPGYEYTRVLNYLEMPLLTHIYIGGKRARFFINLGPKIGFMLSESTTENVSGVDFEGSRETNQYGKPVEQKFGWGLCGGPGFELRTGIGTFNIEGRYYYSLGDIYRSHSNDHFNKSSGQVFSVKLAYLFPIL